MMIDRLQDALSYLEHLPLEAQEEAAIYIEALAEVLIRYRPMIRTQPEDALSQQAASLQWQDHLVHGVIYQTRHSTTWINFAITVSQHRC